MLEIYEAINSRLCPGKSYKVNAVEIVKSMWLTMGNIIPRLYVSSSEPSENILVLTHFILKVYAIMWFHI